MLSASGRSISTVLQRLQTFSHRATCRSLSTSAPRPHPQAKGGGGSGGEGGSAPPPIPFSSSKAATWSMTKSVMQPKRDVPPYQAWSVSLSMLIFFTYFLFLREENDLDRELNYSLFERVPRLEEHQLQVAIDNHRRMGRDAHDLEQRLAEIQSAKLVKDKDLS